MRRATQQERRALTELVQHEAVWGEPMLLIPAATVRNAALTPTDCFVLGALYSLKLSVNPQPTTVSNLAEIVGCAERSVSRSLTKLVEEGCVQVIHRPGQTSLYEPPTTLSGVTVPSGPPPSSLKALPRAKALGPGKPRQPDLLFEALCKVGGHDLRGLTRTARGMLNKARKELAEIDATPQDVEARAKEYRKQHPDWDFTVPALIKHWDTCRPAGMEPDDFRECSRCGKASWEHDERLMDDFHHFQ